MVIRLYVKRETALNKVKVLKLLLSEIKDKFFLVNKIIGLEAAMCLWFRNRTLINIKIKPKI